MDLSQGSNIKLDRLTLGPGSSHWGVHRAPDGVFQSFSDVSNRDRFVELLESKADINKSSSQIDFVSLGYGGGWAFSVNGSVEYRCGKPFENKVKEGWQAQKKLSVSLTLKCLSLLIYGSRTRGTRRQSSCRQWVAYGSSFGRMALCLIIFLPTSLPKLKATASHSTLSKQTRKRQRPGNRRFKKRQIRQPTNLRRVPPPRSSNRRTARPKPRVVNQHGVMR